MEDLGVVLDAGKQVGTGTGSKDGDILEGVDTDLLVGAHGSALVDSVGVRDGVGLVDLVVVVGGGADNGRDTGAVDVDLEILAVGWEASSAGSQGVADVPVVGEAITVGIDVRGPARVLIGTDRVLLLLLLRVGERVEVLGVNRAVDIEGVSVISGDEDQGVLVELVALEPLLGLADGVVQLQKISEGAVVVERVHHLVDRGGLSHHEPTLLAVALVQDFKTLEDHLVEVGLVEGGLTVTGGIGRVLLEVLLVDVAVHPDIHVSGVEDSEEGVLALVAQESVTVVDDLVAALLGVSGVVVGAVEGLASSLGVEVLSTTSEDDISDDGVGTVNHLINNGGLLVTVAGVGVDGSGGGILDLGSGNDTDTSGTTVLLGAAAQQLGDELLLGVIEGVDGGIGVDTQGTSRGLVASVVGGGRVGRVGDQGIQGMGHDVTENGELVHVHVLSVLSAGVGLGDQTGSGDHGGGHTITNEKDDVLSLALLDGVDGPDGLSLLAVVVLKYDLVGTGLVDLDMAPGGRGDVDIGGGVLVTVHELPVGGGILVVGKVPGLLGVGLDLGPLGEVDSLGAVLVVLVGTLELLDSQGVVGVGLGIILGVDLDADIEMGTSEELSAKRGRSERINNPAVSEFCFPISIVF